MIKRDDHTLGNGGASARVIGGHRGSSRVIGTNPETGTNLKTGTWWAPTRELEPREHCGTYVCGVRRQWPFVFTAGIRTADAHVVCFMHSADCRSNMSSFGIHLPMHMSAARQETVAVMRGCLEHLARVPESIGEHWETEAALPSCFGLTVRRGLILANGGASEKVIGGHRGSSWVIGAELRNRFSKTVGHRSETA